MVQPEIPALGLKEWNMMCLFDVVAHPHEGLPYCAFRDAFLLATDIKSAYVSYCSLHARYKPVSVFL